LALTSQPAQQRSQPTLLEFKLSLVIRLASDTVRLRTMPTHGWD